MSGLRVDKVRLKSIKTFQSASDGMEISFRKGNNVIVGHNGAGKTTIFEAITLGLFNKCPSVSKKSDLITHGKSDGAINVTITEKDGQETRINRNLKSGRKDFLYPGNDPEVSGALEIESHINELLGIDYLTFSQIVYARQDDIHALASTTPAKRKEALDRLFGVEEYTKLSSELSRIHNQYNQDLKKVDSNIKQINSTLSHMINKRDELRQTELDLEENRNRLINVSKREKKLDKELENLKPLEENYKNIKRKIDRSENGINDLNPEIKEQVGYLHQQDILPPEKPSSTVLEKTSREIKGEQQNLLQSLNDDRMKFSNLQSKKGEYDRLDKRTQDCKQELERRKQRTFSNRKDINKCCPGIFNLEKDQMVNVATSLQYHLLTQLESSLTRNNILVSALSAIFGLVLALFTYPEVFLGLFILFLSFIAPITLLLLIPCFNGYKISKRLPSLLDQWRESNRMLQEEKDHLEQLNEEYEEYRQFDWDQIDILRTTIDKRENRLSTLTDCMGIVSKCYINVKNLEKLSIELKNASGELKDIEKVYDPYEHEKKKQTQSKTHDRVKELEGEVKNQEKNIESLKKDVKIVEELESNLETLKSNKNILEVNKTKTTSLKSVATDAAPAIRELLLTRVCFEATLLLRELGRNLELEDLSLDKDYNLQVKRSGVFDDARILSGGERVVVSLALRMAFVKVMSPVDILILDEPTAHLDPSSVDALVDCLEENRPFSQMFIITHNENFRRVADWIIDVSKDKGVSRISYGEMA